MKRQKSGKSNQHRPKSASVQADPAMLKEIEDNPDFVLMMLDVPISFHRAYVPMTGMVTAALLLSHAVQTSVDGETQYGITDRDGWFTKTQQQWTDEIGLSKDETISARARLRELGVLEERLVRDEGGFLSFLEFRVVYECIQELLLRQAEQMRRERVERVERAVSTSSH